MSKSIHHSIYQELVAELVAARVASGMTQQAVADRLGKPQSYVAKVEGSERRLDVIEFLMLAEVIGFDPRPAISKARDALGS